MINISEGKKMKKSIALMLIGAVYWASMFSVNALSRKVLVNVDNDTISTLTLNSETDKILNQVGVKLGANDSVERYDAVDGSVKIDVKRAFEVDVFKDDQKITLTKSSGTVKDVLDELKISDRERSTINFSESQKLFPSINIVIGKKIKIVISADGETKECFVPEGTVSEAISYLGVPFSSEDLIDVDIFSNVFEGMNFSISRITYREVKNMQDVPFETEIKKSGLLNDCERQVSRVGKKGVREVVTREKLKDGEVIESKEINSNLISQPVNEIVITGTKSANECVNAGSVNRTFATSAVAASGNRGARCVCGSATAYTASKGAKTSTGKVPVEGVTVAVNPKVIPYGSRVRVETNDGKVIWNGIAQDTGGALRSGKAVVDIYMSSTSKCIRFGRKNVKVYY